MKREELVEKMRQAIQKAWWTFEDDDVKHQQMILEAALDVAVGELLKPFLFHRLGRVPVEQINAELDSRRAQLEKVKTPEERVTIFDNDKHLGKNHNPLWVVQLDGETVLHLDKKCFERKVAEIYRLGLIAKLKEDAK